MEYTGTLTDNNATKIIISETTDNKIDYLFEAHKADPIGARVMMHSIDSSLLIRERIVVFQENDSPYFAIHKEVDTLGISDVNNKIYLSRKKERSIIYTKNGFYVRRNSKLRLLTSDDTYGFDSRILNYLMDKLPKFRFLKEQEGIPCISFNNIVKNKLYSRKKILKHYYGFRSNKVNEILHYTYFSRFSLGIGEIVSPKKIKKNHWLFKNPESLTNIKYPLSVVLSDRDKLRDLDYDGNMILDCLLLHYYIHKPFNCSWSYRRIKEEHDKATQIMNMSLKNLPNDNLNIGSQFNPLIEYLEENHPEITVYTNSDEVVQEGINMRHCVGSYVNKINKGNCIICHYSGETDITIEFSFTSAGYKISQMQCIYNESPDKDIRTYIRHILDTVNDNLKIANKRFECLNDNPICELPF